MFAVIYSKNTGRIRSIIKPDKDSDLNSVITNKGESYLILDDNKYIPLDDLQTYLNSKTGLEPKDDEYDIVDENGQITGSVVADPLIDSVDGHTLVKKSVVSVDEVII